MHGAEVYMYIAWIMRRVRIVVYLKVFEDLSGMIASNMEAFFIPCKITHFQNILCSKFNKTLGTIICGRTRNFYEHKRT